jgi:hypothetical protein
MKKVTLISVIFFLAGTILYAQDYIKPVNEKGFYADIKDQSGDYIVYESNDIEFSIPKSEIVLVEYLERGVVLYNKQYIKELDLTNYTDLLYSKGNNIYVPFASNKIAQRAGSITLRKLLEEDGFWNMVDCEQEAHCIIEYVFNGSGRDRAYLRIKDRKGTILYESPTVSASDWVPYHAGEESATDLYKKIIKKKIQKSLTNK